MLIKQMSNNGLIELGNEHIEAKSELMRRGAHSSQPTFKELNRAKKQSRLDKEREHQMMRAAFHTKFSGDARKMSSSEKEEGRRY